MAKRNDSSAMAIVEKISDADKSAKEAQQGIIAKIPPPTYVDKILRSTTYVDRLFNVRDYGADDTKDEYAIENNTQLYTSLKTEGLRRQNPLTFSKQADGRLLVLAGNLRSALMDAIDAEALVNDPNAEPPFRVIHGLVYENITREQELMLMNDHAMSKKLSPFEMAKAVGEFSEKMKGLSLEKIGIYFGMGKSTVQRLCMQYAMPTVFNNLRAIAKNDPTAIKVGQVQLHDLYKAYQLDLAGGLKYRQEGPAFRKAWEAVKNGGTRHTPPEKPIKGEERENIINQADSVLFLYGEAPEMIIAGNLLRWAAKKPGPNGEEYVLSELLTALRSYNDDLRTKAGIDNSQYAPVEK